MHLTGSKIANITGMTAEEQAAAEEAAEAAKAERRAKGEVRIGFRANGEMRPFDG